MDWFRNPIDGKALGESQVGAAEAAANLVTGGIMAPLAGGLAYIPAAIAGGDDAGQAVMRDVNQAFTYEPRTDSGQRQVDIRHGLLEPVHEGIASAMTGAADASASAAKSVGFGEKGQAAAYSAGKTAIPAAMAAIGVKAPVMGPIKLVSPKEYFSSITGKNSAASSAAKPHVDDLVSHAESSGALFNPDGWANVYKNAKYYGGLAIDGDTVVLTRFAGRKEDLLKETIAPADGSITRQSMMATAVQGSGSGIPTSFFKKWENSEFSKQGQWAATFTLTKQDIKKLIDDGDAILGNAHEGEIILNPIRARDYVTSVYENKAHIPGRKKTNHSVPYKGKDLPPPPPSDTFSPY